MVVLGSPGISVLQEKVVQRVVEQVIEVCHEGSHTAPANNISASSVALFGQLANAHTAPDRLPHGPEES